jgi:hypothetical protein
MPSAKIPTLIADAQSNAVRLTSDMPGIFSIPGNMNVALIAAAKAQTRFHYFFVLA